MPGQNGQLVAMSRTLAADLLGHRCIIPMHHRRIMDALPMNVANGCCVITRGCGGRYKIRILHCTHGSLREDAFVASSVAPERHPVRIKFRATSPLPRPPPRPWQFLSPGPLIAGCGSFSWASPRLAPGPGPKQRQMPKWKMALGIEPSRVDSGKFHDP